MRMTMMRKITVRMRAMKMKMRMPMMVRMTVMMKWMKMRMRVRTTLSRKMNGEDEAEFISKYIIVGQVMLTPYKF